MPVKKKPKPLVSFPHHDGSSFPTSRPIFPQILSLNPSPSSTVSSPIPWPLASSSFMAAAHAREATPPPVIGKAGRYTVFITPPPTPKLSESPRPLSSSLGPSPSPSPRNVARLPVRVPSQSLAPGVPPVQVPPPQFEKPASRPSASVFGFFWNAVAKVQDVHSSLDEYLADLFGLNRSKYQWALNDYYENNEKVEGGKGGKPKELTSKGQAV